MAYIDNDEIQSIYDSINEKNDKEYFDRLDQLYKKYKGLKEIKDKLFSLKINLAKAKILNEKQLVDTLEKEVLYANDEYKTLLSKYNLKDVDLAKHYDCEICKDTGYVKGRKCECYIAKEIEVYRKLSNYDINNNYKSKFQKKLYKQDFISADGSKYYDYMLAWLKKFNQIIIDNKKQNIPFNIFFSGRTGTGKTFISRYLGEELLKINKKVLYTTVNDLIDRVIKNDNSYIEYLNVCDVLILDNFGKENKYSDYSIRYIYNLIDKRLIDKKSTIICSLYTLTEIDKYYDSSLASRLFYCYDNIRLDGMNLNSSFDKAMILTS